ncbi:peptidoglycan-binding domain-containing protein [Streptomyces sp. NPDC023327]|uniref:peptidoglycan-binding domain-containing protein n=1 Tax=Streptomyces sp. NPDC023327 TaxID=3157088 RepID=UPI0033D91BF1
MKRVRTTRKIRHTIRTTAGAAVVAAALAMSAAGPAAAHTPVASGATGTEWRLCMYLGGHTTLQTGSTGEGVRHLQCILNEVYRYVNVPTTGVFEEVTRASVEHLQRQFSLPVTGVVDTATWAALHP